MAGLAAAGALAAALLGACSPIIHTDGQIPDAVKLATIEPGVQGEDEVKKLIGAPSTESVWGQKTWYYITKRTSRYAFFSPDTEEQKVIAISFDQSGKVDSVHQYGLNDAKDVSPTGRVTPSKGKQLTILDQLLGNLNKYGAAAPGRAGPSGGGGGGGGGGY